MTSRPNESKTTDTSMLRRIDRTARRYTGISLLWAMVLVSAPVMGGALLAWLFPKVEATAMLQFPERQEKREIPKLEIPKLEIPNVDLQAYRRVAATYDSRQSLQAYLQAAGEPDSSATQRLLQRSREADFLSGAAVPVLPYTKRDQKQFGDIKDAEPTRLLGLELNAAARTEPIATEMIRLLARYIGDAVIRERIRAWVLAGKTDSGATARTIHAAIVRTKLEIELSERRAEDMKSIITRYPEANRMDAQQVLYVNPEGGTERFLSPLAQLVGAESSISHGREQITRMERDLRQKELLFPFFLAAEPMVDQYLEASKLITALSALAGKMFGAVDTQQEWAREAALRVGGALEFFAEMQNQIGIRSEVSARAAPGRTPLTVAILGMLAGVGLVGGKALLRPRLQTASYDNSDEDHRQAVTKS